MEELYQKYKIEKADGTPVDPDAKYFVLRPEKDAHAKKALETYVESLLLQGKEIRFAWQIIECYDLDKSLYLTEKVSR